MTDLPTLSPWLEMGAYEALWDRQERASFKTMADRFRADPDALPSDFVSPTIALKYAQRADDLLKAHGAARYGIRINKAPDYPYHVRDADHPIELLYYQGFWEIAELPSVAVVGTRKPTKEGRARARKLIHQLVEDRYVIVSGLAEGIDSEVHQAAIEAGGLTIAVIGTPLGTFYPRSNHALQETISTDYLLISQVPTIKYESMPFQQKRSLFPERNITMSALALGTIIVEAGETSGTLKQAKAALKQKRKLFILNSCFEDPNLTWPVRLEREGALRVRSYDDIRDQLSKTAKDRYQSAAGLPPPDRSMS